MTRLLWRTLRTMDGFHPRGQGAPLGAVQLPRLAHRGGNTHTRRAAPRSRSALLQRDEPHARSRGAASVRVLRVLGVVPVQPARARHPHRQVQADEKPPEESRAAQRPAIACRRNIRKESMEHAAKMAEHAKHRGITPPVRHGLGARQRHRPLRCSPARARSSSGRSTSPPRVQVAARGRRGGRRPREHRAIPRRPDTPIRCIPSTGGARAGRTEHGVRRRGHRSRRGRRPSGHGARSPRGAHRPWAGPPHLGGGRATTTSTPRPEAFLSRNPTSAARRSRATRRATSSRSSRSTHPPTTRRRWASSSATEARADHRDDREASATAGGVSNDAAVSEWRAVSAGSRRRRFAHRDGDFARRLHVASAHRSRPVGSRSEDRRDASGYRIASSSASNRRAEPALVPFAARPRSLNHFGDSRDVFATTRRASSSEGGPHSAKRLVTHRGLSGPSILQTSRTGSSRRPRRGPLAC